jgi:hypothetical protein
LGGGSLKKGTRTFNVHVNEPSRDIPRPLGQYDHPWGKEKKTHPCILVPILTKYLSNILYGCLMA